MDFEGGITQKAKKIWDAVLLESTPDHYVQPGWKGMAKGQITGDLHPEP